MSTRSTCAPTLLSRARWSSASGRFRRSRSLESAGCAVEPAFVTTFVDHRSVAGRLEDWTLEHQGGRGKPVLYQVLQADAAGLTLSSLRQYPEAEGSSDAAPEQFAPTVGSIRYPEPARIELTLTRDPGVSTFTLYLEFTNYLGRIRLVAVTFTRGAGATFTGSLSASALANLQSLADTGSRSHWDRMTLYNFWGSGATYHLGRLRIDLSYDDLPSGCTPTITIVNSALNSALGPNGRLALDVAAVTSRRSWAGVVAGDPWVVQIASEDFGKSGSDGVDGFGQNPKYNGENELLCSEFVSWYYFQGGTNLGNGTSNADFRDIESTQALNDVFRTAGRLYAYHNGQQRWLHMDTGAEYAPRAGDFLERRGEDGAEHSMIVLRWHAATKTATVINGPWPVTLRTVPVHELEVNGGKDFRVGRIGPL
jgi:hypothetical protein